MNLFFSIIQRPGAIPLLLRGVLRGAQPDELLRLNLPWLKHKGVRTVIDVGAYKGRYAAAAACVMADARVYSFEPLPDCFDALQRRLAGNPKFQAFNVALGDRNEQTTIWRSSFAKSSSLLPMGDVHKTVFPWTSGTSTQSVTVATLDDFLQDMDIVRPVLLKIDVQGYEERVLLGASQILDFVDIIIVEVSFASLYDNQSTFARIHALLSEKAFEFVGSLSQRLSPVDSAILQSDVLFMRSR